MTVCLRQLMTAWQLCPWQLITAYDNFWQLLTTFDIFWQLLTTFDNFWQLLTTFDKFWQVLTTFDDFWQSGKDIQKPPEAGQQARDDLCPSRGRARRRRGSTKNIMVFPCALLVLELPDNGQLSHLWSCPLQQLIIDHCIIVGMLMVKTSGSFCSGLSIKM